MSHCLRRCSARHLARHPLQFGLSVVGVAVGVAVVVSIDLAAASAHRAFEVSTATVTGNATHQVVGGPAGLPEGVFARIVLELGIRRAAPVVVGHLSPHGQPARMLPLLGVDPFREAPFRAYLTAAQGGLDLGPFLTRPGAFAATRDTADDLGVDSGESLSVDVLGRGPSEISLVGIVQPADEFTRAALADLLVVDIASAQELLGMGSRLSRIDLILEPDRDAELDRRLRALLPAGAELIDSETRAFTSQQMTRAFRINLTALSLLALLCGMFLIYNTMTFSVVQRRPLIGTLRTLGVTRRQIFAMVSTESMLVAALGTALGLVGGIFLGRFFLGLVTRTINDLYFAVTVREFAVSTSSLLKAGALGVGASTLAALAPAIEATTAPATTVMARSALEARVRALAPRVAVAGLTLLLAGGALLAAARDLPASFAALFAIILGLALLTPWAAIALMRLFATIWPRPLRTLGRMAAGAVVASSSRTGVAIAALMIAVAVVNGVGIMIDSFRRTVVDWLDGALRADVYISAPGPAGVDVSLDVDPVDRARLLAVPGVDRLNTVHAVTIEAGTVSTRLIVFDIDARSRAAFDFKEGDPGTAWKSFASADGVLVTEPFSYRRGVGVGDLLTLRTDRGWQRFPIAGVYYNYAADQGLVAMSRSTYERYWDDPAVSGMSLHVSDDADESSVVAAVRDIFADRPVLVRSNRELQRASLEVFDRTFLITGVLRTLVTIVAVIGVLSALMALQVERSREIGVLRALGFTPAQIRRLITAQSGLMGLAAGLLAVPVGLLLAAIMIFVINRRSFGWTLHMSVDPLLLAQSVALAILAALLAGLYPGSRMARLPVSQALREE